MFWAVPVRVSKPKIFSELSGFIVQPGRDPRHQAYPPHALEPGMDRTLQRIVTAKRTPEGDGMVVQHAFPGQEVGRIDPFLMLDEMGPIDFEPDARAGFPDHPHRGFETVTYLLEGA